MTPLYIKAIIIGQYLSTSNLDKCISLYLALSTAKTRLQLLNVRLAAFLLFK